MEDTDKIDYGDWQAHPGVVSREVASKSAGPTWASMDTKHEGRVLYAKYWNFRVRAGAAADARSDGFFRDYETATPATDKLMGDIGFPGRNTEKEEVVWERIGMAWSWLKNNVRIDGAAHGRICSPAGEWPSIGDHARYNSENGGLVRAACFSKAHMFATLHGRMAYPRYRFGIEEAHHAENGAQHTATHAFVAAYLAGRWFHLDPTAASTKRFPAFAAMKSLGVDSFTTVDYAHPYDFMPVPSSGFERVAYLPA